MTAEELEMLIREARWFENLCEPITVDGIIQIPSLAPWANIQSGDATLDAIADHMDWLPSSKEQLDPIYRTSLEEQSEQLGKSAEYSRRSLGPVSKRPLYVIS